MTARTYTCAHACMHALACSHAPARKRTHHAKIADICKRYIFPTDLCRRVHALRPEKLPSAGFHQRLLVRRRRLVVVVVSGYVAHAGGQAFRLFDVYRVTQRHGGQHVSQFWLQMYNRFTVIYAY